MRLIDADARVTVQSFDAMNEKYNHNEMTVEQALDFATDEGCPPTIDAIPVEWLQGMARRTEAQAEPHFAFMYVLHEWQESKPIEVQQAESEMRDWKMEQEAHGT